jgi:5-(aminomethyl)-3-furanmethanol phosphate kinase
VAARGFGCLSIATRPQDQISVIKVGGKLASQPQLLDRVCTAVATLSRSYRIVVVPGGGPFAAAIREFEQRVGISADAAHWMAILAMDQYAHVLAGRIRGAILVEESGALKGAASLNRVAVLAPSRWMRSADVLPHTWDVTSDSIAAFVAGALDAARLVLIKPTENGAVDPYFHTALPVGMSWSVLSWDRIEELPTRLNE